MLAQADEFASKKRCVRTFLEALDSTAPEALGPVLGAHLAQNHHWRGMHPFEEITGPEGLSEGFWRPLRSSLTSLQRRMDIFFAGRSGLDGGDSVWVAHSGHLMGLFDRPWLGIPPTGKLAFLRYAEFHRVVEDRIAESALFIDIPHLMIQAGLTPFPVQTAAHLVQPGPQTHDGLLFAASDPGEGAKTLALIESMIADLGQWDLGLPLEEELARSWHDDMLWWGPAGIGSTYTIPRYARQHSGAFRGAFTDRSPTRHVCRMAEGRYGGFFGWPNFTARPTGGFMGMPATGKAGEFRVVDLYRRRGDKLAENWVYIDLLHFWAQQGVDILARTTGIEGARP